MRKLPMVRTEGYPEADMLPASPKESECMARRQQNAEATGPLGAPNFKQPAGSPRLRVSGMTYAEAADWFRTGEMP